MDESPNYQGRLCPGLIFLLNKYIEWVLVAAEALGYGTCLVGAAWR